METKYEKKLKPGQKEGVPLSLFNSWLHFDFRFGKTWETVCERFINSPFHAELKEPGPTYLKYFAQSYCTFYEILDVLEDRIIFNELGIGREWQVYRINEPFEKEAKAGDIWYLRLLGTPSGAYIYTPPYIFPPFVKTPAILGVKQQKKLLSSKSSGKRLSQKELFRESCKASVPFWAEFFQGQGRLDDQALPEFWFEKEIPELQIICNTDGELLSFSKIFFRVKEKKGLRQRLSSLKELDYDDKHRDWTWFKEDKRKSKLFKRTLLGNLYLKGSRLVGETNSIERAARLINLLAQKLGNVLSYEKMESVSFDSLPRPTAKEMKIFEDEQKELYSNPELRQRMMEDLEGYYLKEWIHTRIPAFRNQTPLEAIKTEEGRHEVKRLLDYYEALEKNAPSYKPKFNYDKLRKKLGFPPKVH